MEDQTTDDVDTDVEDQAAFASGFDDTTEKQSDKEKPPEPARETKQAEAEPPPEYVQITKKDWDDIRAAAAKTASYDKQLSSAFGSIGTMQKVINDLRSATPRGIKVEIPKDAFADMERDFPELAQQNRTALERALSGITGVNDAPPVDPNVVEWAIKLKTREASKEVLDDAYPDWKEMVGFADGAVGEQPNPEHPFRKWLATKEHDYQKRILDTESAPVLIRAINLFQKETKPPAKPPSTPAANARREQIAAAVQPRGDGSQSAPRNSAEDSFQSGFQRSA